MIRGRHSGLACECVCVCVYDFYFIPDVALLHPSDLLVTVMSQETYFPDLHSPFCFIPYNFVLFLLLLLLLLLCCATRASGTVRCRYLSDALTNECLDKTQVSGRRDNTIGSMPHCKHDTMILGETRHEQTGWTTTPNSSQLPASLICYPPARMW